MNAPVVPSRALFDPNKETQHPYTPAASTSVAATFARVRAEQEAAKRAQPNPNVKPIRRTR